MKTRRWAGHIAWCMWWVRNAHKIFKNCMAVGWNHSSYKLLFGKTWRDEPTFERVIHLFKTKSFLKLTLCSLVDKSTKLLVTIFQKTYIEFVFVFWNEDTFFAQDNSPLSVLTSSVLNCVVFHVTFLTLFHVSWQVAITRKIQIVAVVITGQLSTSFGLVQQQRWRLPSRVPFTMV